MRKLLSSLLPAVLLLLGVVSSALSQTVLHPIAAGKFDVRFTIKNLDCTTNPRKVTIAVQVKARSIQDTFLMGDANYRFRYKSTQLQNPVIVSQENFSSVAPASNANYAPQNLNGSGAGPTEGIVSLNTFYSGSNLGAKLVGTTWMTVSCVRFDVLNGAECFDIVWHDNNTFPVTGMNEVYNIVTDPSFDYKQADVTAAGYFGNVNVCMSTYCAPILAVDDINTTLLNTPVTGSVLTNDIGSGLTVTLTPISPPLNGTLTLNSNGNYTYTPNTGFIGKDAFKYKVCDNLTPQKCDTALVTISVLPNPPTTTGQNTKPNAQNDVSQTNVGMPVSGNVLANDTDPDAGQTLTVSTTPVNPPLNGMVVINPNGTYIYTPNPGFSGQDVFTYQVCDNGTPKQCDVATVTINVTPQNLPAGSNLKPVAGDDAGITPKNTTLSGGILSSNDSDPNAGQTLTYTTTPILAPAHGTVSITPTGTYTYTPTTNYTGPDKFTYKVCDNGTPVLCDTATVYLTVLPDPNPAGNNLPTITAPPTPTTPDDPNIPLIVCVPFADADATDTHNASICGVKNGTVTQTIVDQANKKICFTYVPAANKPGMDSVCVQVCDNKGGCASVKVPINVTPLNVAPSLPTTPLVTPEDSAAKTFCLPIIDGNLPNDTHTMSLCAAPKHAASYTVALNNVTHQVCITYKGLPDYSGQDTLCIKICDAAGACSNVQIPIVVTPTPDAPVVTPPNPLTTPSTGPKTTCFPYSDADKGDTHTVSICNTPAHGTATATIDPITKQVCVTFTPTAGYTGPDQLCVKVCDQTNLCSQVTVPVNITPNANPPAVTPAPITVPEDGSPVTVCSNITDSDPSATHTATVCNTPTKGTATVTVNNTTNPHQVCVTYTPLPNQNGRDTVCVTVCDNSNLCTTIKVPVVITPVNDPPVVVVPPFVVPEDSLKKVCMTIADADANDTHTITLCGQPANGSVTVALDNNTHQLCVTYIPNPNFNGTDAVCIKVCDAAGACTNVNIPITVTPVNDKPVAINDVNLTNKGVPVSGNVLTNDSDPDAGQTLTVSTTPVANPLNGTVTLNANGTYTYTPNPTFVGTDAFKYRVCDSGTPTLCDTATVTIEVLAVPVNGVNSAPVAVNDNTTTPSNKPITINVKNNDFDPDNNTLGTPTLLPNTGPSKGTVTPNGDGTFTYTPNPGSTGPDSFKYSICDNGTPVKCDTATVTIEVTPATNPGGGVTNDPPVPTGDAKTTIKNNGVLGNLALNDTDPNVGQVLTFSKLTNPLNGTVTVTSTGTYIYTPNNGFVGNDSFDYKVCDNGIPVLCATSTVTIAVTESTLPPGVSNVPPVANDDNPATQKGNPVIINVKANDYDPFNGVLGNPSLIPGTGPLNGTATLNADGTITYAPNPTFVGIDAFKYKICDNGTPTLCDTATVTINVVQGNTVPPTGAVNLPPTAVDDAKSTSKNTPVSGFVAPNDTDPNAGQTLTFTQLTSTLNGTITGFNASTGAFTYTPNTNFVGNDRFTYKACDNGTPSLCSTATVYLTVTGTNNTSPVVNPPVNSPTLPEDGTPIVVCMTITDPDAGDTHTVTPCGALNGTVTYTINNATSPHQVCATYTPNPNFFGTDSICVKVCDNNGGCVTTKIPVKVTPTPDPPVIPAPPVTTLPEDGSKTVCLPITDPDANETHTVSLCAAPKNGSTIVTVNNATTPHQVCITYTPLPNFNGKDTVCVRVCDATGLCVNVKVPFDVTPVNDKPVATNDAAITPKNVAVSGNVLTNDTDPDGNPLTASGPLAGTGPSKGTVTISPNGAYTYTPTAGATGTDSFKYQVCDNATPSLCDTATVTITIIDTTPPVDGNLPPIVLNDNPSTPKGKPVVINVTANDADPEGTPLTKPTITTPPLNGTAVVNPDGTVTYTPNPTFVGDDAFTYQVCDTGTPQKCTTGTVTVTVTAPSNVVANEPPVPTDDAKTLNKNSAITSSVATNDTDPNVGQTLTFSNTSSPLNGTLSFSSNGNYTYTPNTGFVGNDSFTYKVCDNGTPSMCANATATFTIIDPAVTPPANTLPVANDDNSTTPKNTPVSIPVKANDIYIAGTLGNPATVSNPLNGSVVVNSNGTMTYTPNTNFVGIDSYKYKVCDAVNAAKCDTAVVTINVKDTTTPSPGNSNNPPVAIDDQKITTKATPVSGTVALNDSDPDVGQTISFTKLTNPLNGSVLFNPDGSFTYTPNATFLGTDAFTYKVCDSYTPSLCTNATAYITVLDKPCVTIDLKVFLEGPFDGTSLMSTVLNQRGLLPGQTPIGTFAVATPAGQPYKVAPWNYAGTETITNYPATTVDWVLVTLRSDSTKSTVVFRAAGLLQNDGTITFVNPCFNIPNGSYFVLIEHRNHMGVMSKAKVPVVAGKITYDFRTTQSYALTNPPSYGQKQILTKYVMYAGDGKKASVNDNFDINFNDSQLWKVQSGTFDVYLFGDFNLDADTNFMDSSLWKKNSGRFSGVLH